MKTGADWYPRDPQKFLMGCMGLTAKEIAVYQITVDLMYSNAGECPNEPKFISGFISDMGAASVRRSLDSLLEKGKVFITENGRLSNETVRKLAKTREETKEKRRKSGEKGGKKSADLRRKAADLPPDSSKNSNIAQPSGSTSVQPDKIRVDKNRIDKSINPHTPKGDLVGEFERLWEYYPRKVGKGNAQKAFIKARSKVELIEIALPIKKFVENMNGTEMSKIPHLSTWLNQERWNDDQTHAANRAQTSDDQMDRLMSSDEQMNELFSERKMLQ